MRPKAYSYIRFSTSEQIKGDSLRRQAELSKAYAEEHNLALDTSLTLNDFGFSAYKGDHIEKGAFGAFLTAVDEGKIKPGSYLLIENFDRFSRQKPSTALSLFMSILEKGIIIVTLGDGRKYENAELDTMDLIVSLMSMARAHEESVRKGQMIKNAWDNKKANISNQKLTKWSPKWLNLTDDRKEFHINEPRAAIVKEIFEWASQGLGTNLIIQRLESRKISPWPSGSGIKSDKRTAKRWHGSYIQRLLTGREVLGEYKLRTSHNSTDHKVIPNYYPRIIEDELFYRVQQARIERSNKKGGRKGKTVSNLFSKLAICGYSLDDNFVNHRCDGNNENMLYINKGKKSDIRYLQCSRTKNGSSGCESCRKMYRYDYFETAFLTHIKDIEASTILATRDSLDSRIQDLEGQICAAAGRLDTVEKEIQKFLDAISKLPVIPDAFTTRVNELEKEKHDLPDKVQRLQAELDTLEHERDHSGQVKNELNELIKLMAEVEGEQLFDLRLQLSELLKKVIASIEVYSKGRIYDAAYYDFIEKTIGREAADTLRLSRSQTGNTSHPIFIVNYKSGQKRMVSHDPKSPRELIISTKWDEHSVLDSMIPGVSN